MTFPLDEKKCIICRQKFRGPGNNAVPVRKGQCCDNCNINVVIPRRIGGLPNGVK